MDKNIVDNYLISNGKYFPNNKLNKIGRLLEKSNASPFSINRRFFNPLFITILFWVFYPFQLFDRLLLKDWFWGFIKLLTPFVIGYIVYNNYDLINSDELILERLLMSLIIMAWALWTIIDGFTIYRRTKNANYKALLSTLKKYERLTVVRKPKSTKKKSFDENNSASSVDELTQWRLSNPDLPIVEFYKQKKK